MIQRADKDTRRRRLGQFLVLVMSLMVGLLAGLGAEAFRFLIALFQDLFWGSGGDFIPRVQAAPWWMVLLIPAAGGLAAGPIITYLSPEAKGPGVPEVIVSVTNRKSNIRHRVTFLKALVSSLLIGAGASVGREGPIVQIGASVGSSLAQLANLPTDLKRVLLASGAAAGIAATFNAPIAGTMFAIEIILLDVEISNIGAIIIASVTGSAVGRFFRGDLPTLQVQGFHLVHYWEMGFYLLLGILAGLTAIAFIRLLDISDRAFNASRLPEWARPALGGLGLGAMALALPDVLGVGYHAAGAALTGKLALDAALLILGGKLLATALCIGSGMSGGIFAPSLVIGSALGTALALGADGLGLGLELNPVNYALAGMGAVVAGTTLAPITAILTIFELTSTYHVIAPLMAACLSSTLVVKYLFGYSVYEWKLLRLGVDLARGADAGLLRDITVREVMHEDYEKVPEGLPLMKLLDLLARLPYPHLVVLDERGRLAGVVSMHDLKPVMGSIEDLKDIVTASDIMTKEVLTIAPGDTLAQAQRLFEEHEISMLPVKDPAGNGEVLGILKEHDLLQVRRERLNTRHTLSLSESREKEGRR